MRERAAVKQGVLNYGSGLFAGAQRDKIEELLVTVVQRFEEGRRFRGIVRLVEQADHRHKDSLTPRVAELCGEDTAALYGECAALWEEAAFNTHEMNEEQRETLKNLCGAFLTSLKKNTKFFRRLALRFFVVRY